MKLSGAFDLERSHDRFGIRSHGIIEQTTSGSKLYPLPQSNVENYKRLRAADLKYMLPHVLTPAAPQNVNIDDSLREVIAVEPHQAHNCALAELHRMLSLGVHNGCHAVDDLPPRILPHSGQVQKFWWLGAHCGRDTARMMKDAVRITGSMSSNLQNEIGNLSASERSNSFAQLRMDLQRKMIGNDM